MSFELPDGGISRCCDCPHIRGENPYYCQYYMDMPSVGAKIDNALTLPSKHSCLFLATLRVSPPMLTTITEGWIKVLWKDGYPEQQDIDLIVKLAGGKMTAPTPDMNIFTLLNELKAIWKWDNYVELNVNSDGWELKISTGGWSGHETIISALEGTFFWFLYWQESKRGGHYKFEGGAA